MRGVRGATGVIAVCASLAACNALTGVSDLGVGQGTLAPDAGAEGSSVGYGTGLSPDGSTGSTEAVDAQQPMDGSTNTADASIDAGAEDSGGVLGPCVPGSIGPRYGAAFAAGFGWSNRSGILKPADGDVGRTNTSTAPIVARSFGFTVPADARIAGFTVEVARNVDLSQGGQLSDDAIALTKGTPKQNGAWPDGTALGPFPSSTYGSTTDTWGATWTAGDVNSGSFGVSVKAAGNGYGHVDGIGVTVHYCVPETNGDEPDPG